MTGTQRLAVWRVYDGMIDRDSYWPGPGGEREFLTDARALLAAVKIWVGLDRALDIRAGSADAQRLFDQNRRALAATAVDELATACDLLADVAREFGSDIERELRDARRLIEAMYEQTAPSSDMPLLRPVTTPVADATRIPEFKAWRHS